MGTNKIDKGILVWLFSGCFLIAIMVIIGGITRLTHSGLSMVDWKLIMGAIPPLNEKEWVATFEKYKQFPEYKINHYYFTLSEFKAIYFWEFLHRFLGRLIGLVFIIPFLYFWLKKRISKTLMPKLILMMVMGAFQGFLGWFMVKSGLVNKPEVSHYRLAAHLITALGTYTYILWVALGLIASRNKQFIVAPMVNKLTVGLFGLLIVQIFYGAFVAGLKAGLIYNTFPKMGVNWIAKSATAFSPFYLNLIENPSMLQFIHRCFAWLLFFGVIGLYFIVQKKATSKKQVFAVRLLLYGVMLQFLLGMFTLLYSVPVVLGVAHQFGALILLSFMVYQLHVCKLKS